MRAILYAFFVCSFLTLTHASSERGTSSLEETLSHLETRLLPYKTAHFPEGLPSISQSDLQAIEREIGRPLPSQMSLLFSRCGHLTWIGIEIPYPKMYTTRLWNFFVRNEPPKHLLPLAKVPDTSHYYCFNETSCGVDIFPLARSACYLEDQTTWPSLEAFMCWYLERYQGVLPNPVK